MSAYLFLRRSLVILIAVGLATSYAQVLVIAPLDYVLGDGDEVVARSLRSKEIDDRQYRVEGNGEISMPLVGRVAIAGLTIHQAEQKIAESLGAFYVEPDVVLSVRVFRSQPVSVIGAVGTPGVHDVRGRKTLVEMLSQAGGVRPDAGKIVKITRLNSSGPLPLSGARQTAGETTVAEVNLTSLLDASNPLQNIVVMANDVITVPRASMVYVVGEVKHAGGFSLGGRESMSALQALALAEGLSVQASPKHARILRLEGPPPDDVSTADRKEIMVDLRHVLSGRSSDVFLRPDDILFVPNSAARKITTRVLETALQVATGILIFGR